MPQYKNDYPMTYVRLDDPDPPETRTGRTRPFSTVEQQAVLQSQPFFWGASWTLEILSCLVSALFLVAIILVLYEFDGKPVPDWPYGITLNALVSVLSTVMKACMAFIVCEGLSQLKWSWFSNSNKLSDLALLDAASRGTAGAFIALLRFVPRHLVTFGCVILVLAAATDPFIQQVIAIQERSLQAAGRSSIQVCNASLYTDYGMGAGPGLNKVPLSTMGAIYSGLFQEQSPSGKNAIMECATGNCTFSPYQSLSFCSRCSNITDSLSMSKKLTGSYYSYNYNLPNGFSFNTAINTNTMINTTTYQPLIKLDTTDLAVILNFTAITASGYGTPPDVSATECTLYYCIDTYHAAVNNGVFTETVISQDGKSNSTSDYSAFGKNVAITPDTCYVNGTRRENKATPECTYEVNYLSTLAMSNSVSPLLIGEGSRPMSNRPSWSSDTTEAIYGTYGNYSDIDSVFKSLVSSLAIHARSKVCNSLKEGTAWKTESYVHVRWPWMIFPIVLVLLSFLFLIITVFHTRRQYIWKSSPLALLFSELRIEGSAPLKPDPTLKGMDSASKEIEIYLESTAEGPRLKAVRTS
ncbi:Protein of unknown function DUF3176 [Penicillium italicum]|uniref:Uncharacterized protein n=1 Tax=Penicillium italicum TaxID=40296 RepID=A0A0A2L4B5_PENIT|nr:Protein of unknown function DUF3176 [Penicillium italicum]